MNLIPSRLPCLCRCLEAVAEPQRCPPASIALHQALSRCLIQAQIALLEMEPLTPEEGMDPLQVGNNGCLSFLSVLCTSPTGRNPLYKYIIFNQAGRGGSLITSSPSGSPRFKPNNLRSSADVPTQGNPPLPLKEEMVIYIYIRSSAPDTLLDMLKKKKKQ